ncbi:AraC family transcriptional regulator [Jidongwangia harbinensis]|uniref:AraC family transcriptional regulator n=1 Tax=Jidongwangia harbinensis TaxID=2878561 RepID=UPI001CDA46A1|nr:AraC family transcriptional regulator [Jidongwangia harbinensis]MCA2213492.1 AraC family transcriptional regulator [Jidongwangia harbinensis]
MNRVPPDAAPVDRNPTVVRFSSHDPDHAHSVLSGPFYPVTFRPDGGERFGIDLEMIQLGPITVGTVRYAGSMAVTAEMNAYHVSLPLRGRTVIRHAGRETVAQACTAAVFGPHGTICALTEADLTELEIKFDRSALESELAALLDRPVPGPIDLAPVMDVADGPGQSWCRLLRLLHTEARQPEGLLRQPLIAARMRQTLMTGLLLSVAHQYRDELVTPRRPGPPRAIRRALDAIHDEPERPFSVADLAGIAGTSVRSLQDGFRQHVGRAPMTYLQEVRLARVHEDLGLADPAQVTVAAVAHRWGFAHLGRFASAYRARFGMPPSARLRGSL